MPRRNEPGETAIAPKYTIHRRGTFPASGRNVAFSLNEGPRLAGKVKATLSWDQRTSPANIVVRLAAFLVDQCGRVPSGNPYYCVNHDNDRSKDGSTLRAGYRRHGQKLRNESITTDLALVDEDVVKIALVAYLQDAVELKHTFGSLTGGKVVIEDLPDQDGSPGPQIEPHLLNEDYLDDETAVFVGQFVRRRSGLWGYRDIALGYPNLADIGQEFGVVFL